METKLKRRNTTNYRSLIGIPPDTGFNAKALGWLAVHVHGYTYIETAQAVNACTICAHSYVSIENTVQCNGLWCGRASTKTAFNAQNITVRYFIVTKSCHLQMTVFLTAEIFFSFNLIPNILAGEWMKTFIDKLTAEIRMIPLIKSPKLFDDGIEISVNSARENHNLNLLTDRWMNACGESKNSFECEITV